MSKQTPGKWKFYEVGDGRLSIMAGTEVVATVHHLGRDRIAEQKANAKLVAAAPKLLRELRHMVEQYDIAMDGQPSPDLDDALDARKLIKELTGGAE